jgi:hypothetical protein
VTDFQEKTVYQEIDFSSQTCPAGSRDWWQLTYQLLMLPFQRTSLYQMDHPIKKSLISNILSQSPQSCPIRRDNLHCHKASIPTIRRGRDIEKAPVKSVSTWIRNQRKEHRSPIEQRRNSFLSITRKKFRLSIC